MIQQNFQLSCQRDICVGNTEINNKYIISAYTWNKLYHYCKMNFYIFGRKIRIISFYNIIIHKSYSV